MGALLSALVDLFGLLGEVTAVTGLSYEAVLTGEALSALEAQVSTLMTVEGLAQAEAFAALGVTGAHMSALAAVPDLIANVAGLGVVFQTVSGVSTLVQAGIRFNTYQKEVSVVNMSLVPWFPEVDYLFPGAQLFARYTVHSLDLLNAWAQSLFQAVGRAVWDSIIQEGRRQIGNAQQELTAIGTHAVTDAMARVAENTRWVLRHAPQTLWNALSQAPNPYAALRDYYTALPGINPAQSRALERRLRQAEQPRERPGDSPWSLFSGESVDKVQHAPGGANQRMAPDWMLPLILGLYGDITPSWGKYIEEIEELQDGPKKKRPRYY